MLHRSFASHPLTALVVATTTLVAWPLGQAPAPGAARPAPVGHIVRMETGKRPRTIGSLGNREALMESIKPGEWNQLHIIAQGHQLTRIVNGQVLAILVDDDAAARKTSGVIALQIEQYGTGRISFRNLWLKQRG